MTTARRIICGLLVAVAATTSLSGCSRTVTGNAVKQGGPGSIPERNDDAEKKYPNLQKECEVLDTTLMAKTVGADPLDIQSTFVGAVCRWQAANPAGLIDITRFWYEQGSLDNEREIAGKLNYQVENRAIVGVPSIVMKTNDSKGACGVASDGGVLGAIGWWVNPQTPGINACEMAVKLMELTLATNA
jgi:hypothetical protein